MDAELTILPSSAALSDKDSVFSSSPGPSSTSSVKYKLDSVTIPSSRCAPTGRSKLATLRTRSKDNLTLGSPVSKKSGRSSSILMKSDPAENEEVSQLASS